ncbi:MAG: response regulator transcription factor [Gammaproteobacteria bacterium]|nr:response regulator transcription factor [Gammaproteobacteria bacterium]NVK88887.1 response regulator transcription factor [Gammaproteobacteria bacterium]
MSKVLVVDDDAMVRMAHERMLMDDFSVKCVESGEAVFAIFDDFEPDVVLLDLHLPGIDGYEICQRLGAEGYLATTSVIFVSSSSDIDTRIKAFESGADDFISKPLDPEELLSKVKVLTERKQKLQRIQNDLQSAQKTVMTAMSTSSELGRVMQFVEHSFSLVTVAALCQSTFDLLNSLDLKATIMTEVNQVREFFSYEGDTRPIERELLEVLRERGRFFDFKMRTQVNYSHVSLLVLNMPVDDPDRYGRIKDLLPAIIGCLNSRLSEIEAQQNVLTQAQELIHSFEVIQMTMRSLTDSLGSNQQKASERLHKMVYELQVFIQRLGLEEDQEERVIKYVDDAVEESLALLDAGETIFTSFEDILVHLQSTVESQSRVVDKISREKEQMQNTSDVADSADIELF